MEGDEEEEEDNKVELCTPGPFDFGDHSGATHEMWVWVQLNRLMLLVCWRTYGGRHS